ncbi:MAG: hypothetical protein IPG68_00010 [Micrococcales bacterium]|nr:hypothetical protein [Micrococcales bacterium]
MHDNGESRIRALLRLRRSDASEGEENASGAHAIRLGLRLVRLMGEAPAGCRLEVRTSGTTDGLSVVVRVSASPNTPLLPGLKNVDDLVAHLAEEVARLLSEGAAVGPVSPAEERAPAPVAALAVSPRDPAALGANLGFVRSREDFDTGTWGMPRSASPEDLGRLLLANPHVELVQVVEALSDRIADDVRETLAGDLHLDERLSDEYLGVPVKAAAALVARSEPGTLPLRFHEHLRGWFSAVDIDVVEPSKALLTRSVPESVAGGLLRLPATVGGSFPGLEVEPAGRHLRRPRGYRRDSGGPGPR